MTQLILFHYRDTWVRKLETASRHYLDTERKKRDKAMSCKSGVACSKSTTSLVKGFVKISYVNITKSNKYAITRN